MELEGRVAVVTGGGNGIGEALCRAFAAGGARGVVVADRDASAAARVAADIGGLAVEVDVAEPEHGDVLVSAAEGSFGPIDLFCFNAGIAQDGGVDAPDGAWQRTWEVNVMSHVWGARAVLPGMLARGEGYFLHTASAAGLLTNIGAAPYAVTKHAVVALAEWLAITHGDAGLRVSCLCPQFVTTNMLAEFIEVPGGRALVGDQAIAPADVAAAVVAGIEAEQFLILPHPEVAEYFRRKATDYDRWLGGMRRLQGSVLAAERAEER